MEFKLVPSMYEGKLFLSDDYTKADCVMNFYVSGDTAFFTNLCGDGFYQYYREIFASLMDHGIYRLRYFCTPKHYRVQKRVTGQFCKIVLEREGLKYNGAEAVECLAILSKMEGVSDENSTTKLHRCRDLQSASGTNPKLSM